MRKHTKRTVRPLRIPVTKSLVDQFGRELHFSLMLAELGHFTTKEFDKIGQCLNTIYGALDLLFAHLKDRFKPEWYWSNTQHASLSGYAWFQHFYNGLQYDDSKSYEGRARAVRRVTI